MIAIEIAKTINNKSSKKKIEYDKVCRRKVTIKQKLSSQKTQSF